MVRIHQISVIRCLKRGCDYFASSKELLQNHKDEKHKEQDEIKAKIYKDKLQKRKKSERERTTPQSTEGPYLDDGAPKNGPIGKV